MAHSASKKPFNGLAGAYDDAVSLLQRLDDPVAIAQATAHKRGRLVLYGCGETGPIHNDRFTAIGVRHHVADARKRQTCKSGPPITSVTRPPRAVSEPIVPYR